ncbi:Sensor histidine kinase RcsC [compost metagenome]
MDARQLVQKTNPEYKIDIHFEDDFESDSQISVNGNEYLLQVAFSNLFENGCKFSNPHRCTVLVLFDSKHIILKFKDAGIGISKQDRSRIFSPFYRGENKDYTDGNGIGLALTEKIVMLHNSTITVVSEENVGTTFIVTLWHS